MSTRGGSSNSICARCLCAVLARSAKVTARGVCYYRSLPVRCPSKTIRSEVDFFLERIWESISLPMGALPRSADLRERIFRSYSEVLIGSQG